jgi:hypothetical protein
MAAKRARVAEAPDPLQHARRLQDLIPELSVEAMRFTSQSKVEETAHQWIGRCDLDPDDPGSVDVVAQSLVFALELATFTPSLSGGAAIDRLARQRKSTDGEEKAALDAAASQLPAPADPIASARRAGSRLICRATILSVTAMAFTSGTT